MAPRQLGSYELLSSLARGGMGEVFLARTAGPEGFSKLLVVKTVLLGEQADRAAVEMFFDEAKLAARLNHPNICQVFDFGESDGTYFLAMEHVHGVSLSTLLRACRQRGLSVPPHLAARLVAEAAAGLEYAHALRGDDGQPLGLVHRDISPSNVMVGSSGAVKLIDFGVAKARNRRTRTEQGQLKGKLAYMSPEQAQGEALDHRSDVYALGLLLHELLTLTRVLERDSDMETLRAAQRGEVPAPSALAAGIPPALEAVVQKALAARPDDRYGSARALQMDLEHWLIEEKALATRAHVASFVQQLFPELGAEPQVPVTPAAFEVAGTRGATRNERSPAVARAAPNGPPEGAGSPPPPGGDWQTRTADRPAPSFADAPPPRLKRGRWPAALVGFALALGLGGALVVWRGRAGEGASPRPRLTVLTQPPGVEVRLDGVLLGKTPLEGLEVQRKEKAKLALAGPGLSPREEEVSLIADLSLVTELRPERSPPPVKPELLFESTPPGATVTLDGQMVGKTPLAFRVEPGRALKVRFELSGHVPHEAEVDPKSTRVVGAVLSREAKRPKESRFKVVKDR